MLFSWPERKANIFQYFYLKLAWLGQAWPARPGLAGPGPAGPGLTKGLSMRKADRSTKIDFLLKNAVLGLFWSFLDLLHLKNGSGSKFYAGKWYREVWKPKITVFHGKNVILV